MKIDKANEPNNPAIKIGAKNHYNIRKVDPKYNATVREGWGEPVKLPEDTGGIEPNDMRPEREKDAKMSDKDGYTPPPPDPKFEALFREGASPGTKNSDLGEPERQR